MFYAKNPDDDQKQFNIRSTWDKPKTNNAARPPSSKKPDSLLKDAGKKAVNYPQVTHDILDQHLANNILKDMGLQIQQQDNQVEHYLNANKVRGSSPQIKNTNQNGDVVSSMAQRLSKLEKLSQAQRMEIQEKTDMIKKLQDQVDHLRRCQNDKYVGDEILKLKEENASLAKKVTEMEQFLLKYGIKWVGNKPDEKAEEKMKKLISDVSQPKAKFNYHLPKEISIDVITRRVDELNYIMEKEGATEIVKNAQGMHQFKKQEPLPIGFYGNGIAMMGFKFFPYGSNDACQILADIMDGYFPYQLKSKYPNGTLLKVLDKTQENYDTQKLMEGKGVDMNNIDEKLLRPLSKDEFLDKLPKNVIKDGKIIPIRSEIAKKFDPQPTKNMKNCRVDTEDGSLIVLTKAQYLFSNKKGNAYDDDKMCTLKIRTETGKNTLMVVMYSNQTIKDMYEAVSQYRENQDKQVEILQNFPRTIFDPNSNQTLEEAGLHPNAQLFFK